MEATLDALTSAAKAYMRRKGDQASGGLQKEVQEEASDKGGDEVSLVVERSVVSLIDPLSQSRIAIPVRGSGCRHVACFDLKTHIVFSCELKPPKATQKGKAAPKKNWSCPVCHGSARWNELEVDRLIATAIDKVGGSVREIFVRGDTWSEKPLDDGVGGGDGGGGGSEPKSSGKRSNIDVIELVDDDDDEEEDVDHDEFAQGLEKCLVPGEVGASLDGHQLAIGAKGTPDEDRILYDESKLAASNLREVETVPPPEKRMVEVVDLCSSDDEERADADESEPRWISRHPFEVADPHGNAQQALDQNELQMLQMIAEGGLVGLADRSVVTIEDSDSEGGEPPPKRSRG